MAIDQGSRAGAAGRRKPKGSALRGRGGLVNSPAGDLGTKTRFRILFAREAVREGWVTNRQPAASYRRNAFDDAAGLVDCASLPRGSLLYVQTKNRHYRIECLGGTAIRIAGHPEYCPTPEPGHVLKSGFIERGKHLRLLLHDCRPVTTSRIVTSLRATAEMQLIHPLKGSKNSR